MIVIAVANNKGGVAKSTTTINAADALRQIGYRVLTIDLDTQCNTSGVFLEHHNGDTNGSIEDIFTQKKKLKDCITRTEEFGDIIVGSKNIASEEFITKIGSSKIIKKGLKDIEEEYDFVICDTPPSKDVFMRNAIYACTGCIIPVSPTKFAIDGLAEILNMIESIKEDGNEQLQIYGILLTLYDSRNKEDKEIKDELPVMLEQLNYRCFKTVIRTNQDIEKCISSRRSLFKTKSRSNGANDYASLIAELLEVI